MGAYISPPMLVDRVTEPKVAELCSISGQPMGAIQRKVFLDQVILLAEGKVEGFASRFYKVPLPNTPVVMEWALTIAEYTLYKRGSGDNVPSKIKESLDQTYKEMDAFVKGEFAIPGAIQLRNSDGISMVVMSDRPVFTEHEFFVPYPPWGGMWT